MINHLSRMKAEGMPVLTRVPALTESTPSSGIFVCWDDASSTFHRILAFSLHQISGSARLMLRVEATWLREWTERAETVGLSIGLR